MTRRQFTLATETIHNSKQSVFLNTFNIASHIAHVATNPLVVALSNTITYYAYIDSNLYKSVHVLLIQTETGTPPTPRVMRNFSFWQTSNILSLMSSSNMEADESPARIGETPTTTPPGPPYENSPGPEQEQEPQQEPEAMDVDNEEDKNEDLASISLPLSKIKRIFKMDPEYYGSSQSAIFATGVATELFIQYFTEQASFLAKMDKRKKLLYKDFSGAVAAQDSLHFLSDTVPKVVPLREVLKENDSSSVATTLPNNTTSEADTRSFPTQQDQVNQLPKGIAISPDPPKPEKKGRDIKSMLSSSSANQKPVRKATINDLVSNEAPELETQETITID